MKLTKLTLCLLASLAGLSVAANAVQAASPWWGLTSGARPTNLAPGSEGVVVATATNIGDATASGPVTIADRLPEGLATASSKAVQFRSRAYGTSGQTDIGPKSKLAALHLCTVAAREVSCTYRDTQELEALGFSASEATGFAPLRPYFGRLEMWIGVKVDPEASGELQNEVALSGGGRATVIRHPLRISEEEAPFGIEDFQFRLEGEGGGAATQAGSHPFQLTNVLDFNQTPQTKLGEANPVQMPRNLFFRLPPGMLANVPAIPECTAAQFAGQSLVLEGEGVIGISCPDDTQIGVAAVTFFLPEFGLKTEIAPVFNLVPEVGEPARFGFLAGILPVTLDSAVRSGNGEDYGVTVSTTNITQLAGLLASEVTFWGTPGDTRHETSRGYRCLYDLASCLPEDQPHPKAFLLSPTSCPQNPEAEPFAVAMSARSWLEPAIGPHPEASSALHNEEGKPLGMDGCNQLPFAPHLAKAEPTAEAATTGTGMEVELTVNDEGLSNPEPGALAQSQVKKVRVTLPEGMSANPSLAEGLGACSLAQYESETLDSEPGTGCPQESKIGSVEVESPLVERKLKGSLYVAKQLDNPFHSLLALYIVAKNPELGVMVRSAGKVEPNKTTGQLVTTFDDIPQLPFNRFHLSFRPGQRSPLITPPACGTYQVKAELFPWSAPETPRTESAQFTVTQGPEGTPCPTGGLPPFKPNLIAGSLNNAAGRYSPFYIHITRHDSEQEITHFSIKLPPGVVGKLAGVPQCSDAQIAAAKAREHEGGGAEEQASPSCPAASEVGHTLVGTGVGNVLAYAPGKVYLAGPYHGSSLSVAAITSAVVGPFDLGTVVVREALRVNPETGEVFVDATGSDPIPHIVDGIPTHLRDIRVYMDKPEFVLNPTSCEPTSTASTVLGAGLNFSSEADDVPITVTSPFQAADCAALPFGPRLSFKLLGGTRRGANPAFRAHLVMNGIGEAAIAKTVVTLPRSEFLDNEHIQTICTRVQFKEGAGNGSNCPAGSVYGYARATTPILSEPLEGPVFLRSSEHQLPDLVAALRGNEITVDLVGRIDSIGGGIRTSFETVPDAPVSEFTLEMAGGQKSLLVNSTSLCTGAHRASVRMEAHNGKVLDSAPKLGAKCSSRKHKHKGKKRHRAH